MTHGITLSVGLLYSTLINSNVFFSEKNEAKKPRKNPVSIAVYRLSELERVIPVTDVCSKQKKLRCIFFYNLLYK